MSFLTKIIGLLFPDRRSGGRPVFDFSKISPRELPRQFARAPPKNLFKNENGPVAVIACLPYKNPLVRSLVWQIKTKRDRHAFALAGRVLCGKLTEIAAKNKSGGVPVIVPMPISRKRRRERGYNQCELMAREMKRSCGFEMRTDILFRNDRSRGAKKQAFRNRSERISAVKGAFSLNFSRLQTISDFGNRNFIIIDDVLTTGSTMDEAILTLQKAGCKNVSGIALAH